VLIKKRLIAPIFIVPINTFHVANTNAHHLPALHEWTFSHELIPNETKGQLDNILFRKPGWKCGTEKSIQHQRQFYQKTPLPA